MYQGVQLLRVPMLAHHQPAVRQTQMQQAGCALGVLHFQRMLQDENLRAVRHWLRQCANAGRLRPGAAHAIQALACSGGWRNRKGHSVRNDRQ